MCSASAVFNSCSRSIWSNRIWSNRSLNRIKTLDTLVSCRWALRERVVSAPYHPERHECRCIVLSREGTGLTPCLGDLPFNQEVVFTIVLPDLLRPTILLYRSQKDLTNDFGSVVIARLQVGDQSTESIVCSMYNDLPFD
jgi:hypothetical protein